MLQFICWSLFSAYREDKELDISCPYALQIPDYCYVNQRDKSTQSANTSLLINKPVYTVEIKVYCYVSSCMNYGVIRCVLCPTLLLTCGCNLPSSNGGV